MVYKLLTFIEVKVNKWPFGKMSGRPRVLTAKIFFVVFFFNLKTVGTERMQ